MQRRGEEREQVMATCETGSKHSTGLEEESQLALWSRSDAIGKSACTSKTIHGASGSRHVFGEVLGHCRACKYSSNAGIYRAVMRQSSRGERSQPIVSVNVDGEDEPLLETGAGSQETRGRDDAKHEALHDRLHEVDGVHPTPGQRPQHRHVRTVRVPAEDAELRRG